MRKNKIRTTKAQNTIGPEYLDRKYFSKKRKKISNC